MRISDWSSDVCSSDLMLLVFSWELDDATVSAPHVPTDLTAIDAALARITAAHPGTRIAAVRTTAGKPDRYDVTLDEGGKTAMLRIDGTRSEEHTSELQSLMRTSYAVFCLNNKNKPYHTTHNVISTNLHNS